ncbi:glycoside hydrolase family 3 N-terminal domain-containing protein [Bacteroides uniformis]
MKKIFKRTSLLLATALIGVTVQAQKSPQDMDRFIDALMRRMTVEEKIGQLNLPVTGEITTGQAKSSDVAKKIEQGLVGGLFNLKGVAKIRDVQKLAVENSRLGIPLLFGMDVIHGYETIFPIPLGLSCTWDMAAIEQSARIAATEASADGISWTFSPMVDISRDPRWGRVSEGSGEDPFLGGAIARAMVLGYQGKDPDDQLKRNDEIMACVKHFALYGAGEAGRDYNTVDMSRNRMFNEYMYPYEAAVHAGVGSVMASFNEVDGVPATANHWLMTNVLRKQWGFNGFVVTDFTGISEMVEHGIGNLQTVSARALNAGVDMDMVSEGFVGTLKKSFTEGKITMKTLDAACRRILEAKYKLGLFDDPYKYCDLSRPARDIFTREHRDAARRIAAESFVLLKNEPFEGQGKKSSRPVLPLEKQGTVAVIGPLGNTRSNMPGTWSVAARLDDYPSLYEGLKEMTAGRVNESFVLLKNEPFEGQGKKSSRPVLPLEKQGTVAVIGPLGNTRSNMPGTWSVAARLDDYPSLYEGLKEMTAGRVNITYAKGSNLIGDVAYEERATLFGRSLGRDNRTDKELLDEALKVASGADVIVAALGESSEMSGESSSRTDLDIPDVQRTLLEALLKTGKPVVLTLFTGRPLTLTWEQEHVPAILNVWFGGSEAAYAIGDVLFGDVNPSGKLTMTFPKNVGQIPLFYNHKNTGRPLAAGNWFEKFRSNYLDVDNEPLYPFGYGLSYTTFQYSDIALSTPVMGQNGSTTAVVTVTNTGKRDGAEVVQLYIRDLVGSITRPVRELKGFEKVFLKAGESKTVSFKITPELLRFYDYDLNHVAEPGDFDVMIGGSSQAEKTARLTLK